MLRTNNILKKNRANSSYLFFFYRDIIPLISMLSIFVVNSIKVVENLNLLVTTKGVSEKMRQKMETIDS